MPLPAVIRPDAMPATAKAAERLIYLDSDNRPVKYDARSALLPADLLRQVVAEVDGMNARLPDEKGAAKMGKILIGSYPNERAKDPVVYAKIIQKVFMVFPIDVGWKAVDQITEESEFPPTRAELHKACTKLVGKRNDIKRAAQAQLAEHGRRDKAKPAKGDEEDRETFLTRLREKYPEGFGLTTVSQGVPLFAGEGMSEATKEMVRQDSIRRANGGDKE